MDIGVYQVKETSNEQISGFIDERKSFVLDGVDPLNMGATVETLEKLIESKGLKCRVYLMGRAVVMAGMATPLLPAIVGGLAASIAIGAHNIATWDPDYEIAKNPTLGRLEINYKK